MRLNELQTYRPERKLWNHISGHVNHSFFWKILAPASEGGGKLSDGALKSAIEKQFGSIEKFKTQFNTKTAAVQGSGWGWLVGSNAALISLFLSCLFFGHRDMTKRVKNSTLSRRLIRTPYCPVRYFYLISLRSLTLGDTLSDVPILGIDIWEHVRFIHASNNHNLTYIKGLLPPIQER